MSVTVRNCRLLDYSVFVVVAADAAAVVSGGAAVVGVGVVRVAVAVAAAGIAFVMVVIVAVAVAAVVVPNKCPKPQLRLKRGTSQKGPSFPALFPIESQPWPPARWRWAASEWPPWEAQFARTSGSQRLRYGSFRKFGGCTLFWGPYNKDPTL